MERKWDDFLAPYEQAVNELKVKLRGIRKQFRETKQHVPIEFVTGRVKPVESILAKSKLRGIPLDRLEEEMSDIAGLRIMCQFVEDIHQVVQLLRNRKDMKVIIERDYITNKKASGYRSYHLVIEYPIQLLDGERTLLAEIQIRTLAMNFWATIEHSLNYKYQGDFPQEIGERLRRAAEAAYLLDEEMSSIREEIQEAQRLFSQGKRGQIESTTSMDQAEFGSLNHELEQAFMEEETPSE
ncbi:GTP pyrophosphokinase [Enterococcus columbae]|uniref:GTP diphosphokinase n=1 Tax=Enterococcus columbae DSM 7374 = ATCC 51263 TaxID=1121865 RepID=S0KMQ9_9ENTE|nr:GTP pyrophosphokinase family protein [Enterococcus columbae]EOT40476.1 GTP diphosphokinase [Enterococcus columbae DSM 7374 = ATCC 51263]EOW80252.1 GTP diphosphokinase [Enterococcus columbae DSM 7374 = ATCC 51263]OJG25588.1 GTP diphosphokinase [Enterococcus columbae DSM 7374 = ATCC 51263]